MIDRPIIQIGVIILQVIVLLVVFLQDYKERMVFWFLFPLIGVLGGLNQFFIFQKEVIILNSIINLVLICSILLIGSVYMKLIRKKKFIDESMGSGDILFFLFLSFCFPTITFVVLLVSALFFSLIIHIVLSKPNHGKTVPLAGLMALFYSFIYVISVFSAKQLIFGY